MFFFLYNKYYYVFFLYHRDDRGRELFKTKLFCILNKPIKQKQNCKKDQTLDSEGGMGKGLPPYPMDASVYHGMSAAGGKYDFLPRNWWARATGSAGWLRVPPVLNSHWFKSAAALR